MLDDSDSMDRILAKPRGLSRAAKIWTGVGAGLAVVLALLVPSLRRWSRAEESVAFDRLRLAEVTRGDLLRDVAAQGRIVAANHPKLFSPAQGIVALAVRPGESVRKGQTLATIASPELAAQLAQERARLESLRSDLGRTELSVRQANQAGEQAVKLREVRLAAAQRDLERAERLRRDGLINEVEHERSKDAVRVAEVELEEATVGGRFAREAREFELEDRRRQVERQALVVEELERRVRELVLTAPFDGLVATLDVDDRDAVAPNAPILTVVDLSQFEVEVLIPEAYADEATPGIEAVVFLGSREVPGTLTSVSPEVSANQVEGTVAFAGPEPPGLRQSQRVSVRLLLERKDNVLKVPRGPFYDSGGGRQVYVLEEGLATLRMIKTGATSVSEVEVLEGLQQGEQILLNDVQQWNGAKTVLVRR
jgi:HlyD family secretion protein